MQLSRKLLIKKFNFPVQEQPPTSFTNLQLITDCPAGTHVLGTVPSDGWYVVRAWGGHGGQAHGGPGNEGGCKEHLCYLYSASKFLLWSANGRWTGYPNPTGHGGQGGARDPGICPGRTGNTDGPLGGGGAGGGTWDVWDQESGGGGGSASGNGGNKGSWDSGSTGPGGGGSGFIAGLDAMTASSQETEVWNLDGLTFDTLECMVLCGGGGGGCGDNGGGRSGGAGGGAWGNGGNCGGCNPGAIGPGGGSFGVGGNGVNFGAGAGAWCVRDYTRNIFTWGRGNGGGIGANAAFILSGVGLYKVLEI